LVALLVALAAAGVGAAGARADDPPTTVPGTAAPDRSTATRTDDAPTAAPISVAVTLSLRNADQLHQLIDSVSDPTSAQYGQYLTPEQFAARFGPTAGQVQLVSAYLRRRGLTIDSVSANNVVIDASGVVADAQRAFGTRLGRYHDARLNRTFTSNDSAVQVPRSIASNIVGVVGLDDHFPLEHPPIPRTAGPLAGAGPAGGYTPAQLKTAYDMDALGFTGAGGTVGLFELAAFKQSNIASYDSQYGLASPAPTVVGVDGGTTTLGNAEVEVELDIEVVQALAPAATIKVFEAPNSDRGVIDAYNAMATSNTTASNSTSWGLCEANSTASTIASESQIFAQMAAQGQSLYAASGDSGAYDCGTSGQLGVDNPADDPNVTGTGGTRLNLTASNAYSSEVPWDTNATEGGGGGVSTKFARPSYQAGVPGLPSACATMRCVPDISADADPATGYSIFTQGGWTSVGGTSAAAPLWAGLTAVYNQDATAAGKPKLGFANPTLYNLAKTTQTFAPFHDITTGHTSTATNWPATAGYDLATGIGTPDANNLARDLLGAGGTPSSDFSISASPASVSVAQGASATSSISTAVTSGSAQTVALSASGLPSGATATFAPASVTAGSASTVTLTSAASTPAGTYPVTITGTAASATHATTVTLTVTAAGGGGPVQVLRNGGFEAGVAAPWSLSSGVLNRSTSEPPHAGTWDAWFDGYGSTHTDTATQSVTIPAGKTSATLQFYLHIDTAETTTTTQYDKFTVKVGTTTVATFSNLNKAAGYAVHSYNVGNLGGQTVTLSFTGTEDVSLQTSFVLDDVTLTAS
jgi:kumamolisin